MIVFVDDEPHYAHYYLHYLREQYGQDEIVFRSTLDDAQVELERSGAEIKVLILDIMMPPKANWNSDDVENGLNSGIVFLVENAAVLKQHAIPVIILTNRDVNRLAAVVDELRPGLHRVEVCQKTQTPAWYLPTIVKGLL